MKALLDFRSGGGLRTVADVQTANVGSGSAAVVDGREQNSRDGFGPHPDCHLIRAVNVQQTARLRNLTDGQFVLISQTCAGSRTLGESGLWEGGHGENS